MKRKDLKHIFDALEKIDNWQDLIMGKLGANSKKSFGSTNPNMVERTIKREEKWLKTAYISL